MTALSAILLVLALTVAYCHGAMQVQMPEAAEMHSDDDLQAQIRDLQKNVSEVWSYVYELRNAVSQHLTHLREHQVVLESSVHRMEHMREGSESHSHLHSDDHHHSGEDHSHSGDSHGSDHSHSGEQHSHGSDHSHSGEQHSHGSDHSHSGEHHSHGNDHSHSDEQHSHGSDHSHSGEHHGNEHSHSGEHGHHTESHSHSYHYNQQGGHSHHGNDHDQANHKDSHENEDLSQTLQVASDPVVEPVVTRQDYHQHNPSRSSNPGRNNSMDLMNEHSFHSHSHHHHHNHDDRNKTIERPKYADYNTYDFAVCNVETNKALPEDEQQNIRGQVTFWQKKSGGPLNLHVRLSGFVMGGHSAEQQLVQHEESHKNHKHGFHVHANGDLSDGCQSTGPHYNPKGVTHGAPNALVRHVGDLGNIECDEHGVTNVVFSDEIASLRGPYSILGKALVIHSQEDDLGLGDNADSLLTGNAGTRLACCVIEKVEKLAIRHYKSMKIAKEYKNF